MLFTLVKYNKMGKYRIYINNNNSDELNLD